MKHLQRTAKLVRNWGKLRCLTDKEVILLRRKWLSHFTSTPGDCDGILQDRSTTVFIHFIISQQLLSCLNIHCAHWRTVNIYLTLSYSWHWLFQDLVLLVDIFAGLFVLWPFDPIPCHGLLLRGFAITLNAHTTLGRTPIDGWSACRRDLYLKTHTLKTDKRPYHRRDKIPQTQEESGCRPTS